jgi:PAS domain S-box-containing protein
VSYDGVQQRGARRRPPSARRLFIGFLAFAATFALVVIALVAFVLAVVRDNAEDDVDAMLQENIETQLQQAADQQAETVEVELRSVREAAAYLDRVAQDAFVEQRLASAEEVARYRTLDNGAYSSVDGDPEQSAMFYAPFDGVTDDEKAKASYLAAVDEGLQGVVGANSLVAAAYLNTYDGMTRIYPGFPIDEVFSGTVPADEFAFYYAADAEHNPGRDVAWTSAYIDPAGQGWIVSAVAPVYSGDFLEGVVGADVQVKELVGQLLSSEQVFDSYSILLDSDGRIVAMPPPAEALFDLDELTDVEYDSFVTEETFKPDDFDVRRRDDTTALAALLTAPHGTEQVTIGETEMLVSWATMDEPTWTVVTLVPVANLEELHAPGQRLKDAAAIMLWVVVLAFLALGIGLTLRARRYSLAFTRPLEAIDETTARIGAGDFEPTLPPAPVAEIQRTGEQLLAMGRSLQAAQERMLADAERLREGEQRYRAIFENVAEPVLTVDVDGFVVDANDAADEMFGRSMEGIHLTRTFGTDVWREPGRQEVALEPAGEPRRVLEIAVSRTGADDTTLYTLTVHDVTAEAEARELLEAARETAERTARLKDEFLASMSHEIRTPLNGVIGVLSLLADRDLPPDAQRELAVARRSADDLLVLVSDVLDFAKIEADEVSVVLSDVRLFDVVEGVCQLYGPFAAEQGNRLAVHIDDDVPEWVQLDPTRVRQVLMNLVSNALKFTAQGEVTIRVRRSVGGAAGPDALELRFEVADTGSGIDPAVQPRLFQRFSQGDPLATRKYPGTGLGLAIVKRLAELMGGDVGVHSVLGDGSTFWFTVPSAVGTPSGPSTSTVSAHRAATGSLRVLVAEDNDVNRYLVVAILERLGHRVVAVENGREAVEAAQTQPFDLVLMDVQMPVANGIDATHAIRALPGPVSRVPILAVTANVLPEQQEVYRRTGFTGWVPKPLTLDQVERAIASVLPQAARPATDLEPEPESEAHIDTPRFDAALIEQYRSVIGPDGSRQMVDLFLQTLDERSAELRAAVSADDLAEVRRIGHAIKGMAAAVGAVELSATGERLQHSEADAVPALMVDFEAAAVAARDGVAAAWQLTD